MKAICAIAFTAAVFSTSLFAAVVYPSVGAKGGTSSHAFLYDKCGRLRDGFVRDGAEIVCDNGGDANAQRGAIWGMTLNQEVALPFTVTAESRAMTPGGSLSPDYSLYVDITYMDGSKLYGQTACFVQDPALGWQRRSVMVMPDKPIQRFSLYQLFRNRPGKVRFRAPTMQLFAGEKFSSYDTCPVVLSRCPPLEAPAFLIRDVTKERGFVSIEPNGAAEGISLAVKTERIGDATVFDVTARETTGKDRAVTLVYAVPIPGKGQVTWHDDPRTDIPLDPEKVVQCRSTSNVGAGEGPLSLWPFGAVSTGSDGIALGIDCSAPAIFRASAHAPLRQIFIAFDLGFTKEHPSAHFRFFRFAFPAVHGFRGALATYQALFPEFSEVRIKEHGLWMAFHRISKVEGWEDFGFKIKEGTNETDWDDAHGITTFNYTEPTTWWMRMPDAVGSYSLADCFMEADRRAANGDAFAQAWRNSIMRDDAGRAIGQVKDAPWCKGAVWSLCPLPGLPDGEYAYKFSDASWNRKYDGKTFPQGVDGEYIDSAECHIPPPLDFNRAHFAHSKTPLAFDPSTKKPAISKCLSIYEYIRATADRAHGIGRYLMGNGIPMRWPWFVPYSDFGGQETKWIDRTTAKWTPMGDKELLYRRAMSGGKPYCFLMNVDFDRFPQELVEKYMQRTLAYGLFACFFSPNASGGHYFSRPELYNRDRPLFRKYVPLCRMISEAGWRPVNTLAVSETPTVFAEQFGDRYLTVFNPVTEPQNVRIRSLSGARSAKERVSGGEWKFIGGVAEATIPPETVRLLDFGM